MGYNKLFKLMIDKKISNNELASKAGVSLNIITRLKRDQYNCYGYNRKNMYSAWMLSRRYS